MASQIDPTKPKDGVAALKSDLRANFRAAKSEIEELQAFVRADRPLTREISVTGPRTLSSSDVGNLLTYIGGGDTWSLVSPGMAGEVAIENNGRGSILLAPKGVDIVNERRVIPAGKSASIRFFQGGVKVKVFVEA